MMRLYLCCFLLLQMMLIACCYSKTIDLDTRIDCWMCNVLVKKTHNVDTCSAWCNKQYHKWIKSEVCSQVCHDIASFKLKHKSLDGKELCMGLQFCPPLGDGETNHMRHFEESVFAKKGGMPAIIDMTKKEL